MRSYRTPRFHRAYERLPPAVQALARRAFRAWVKNPFRPSLHFKPVHPTLPIWSVRVGIHWRALAVRRGDSVAWFWIGPHEAYEKLLASL